MNKTKKFIKKILRSFKRCAEILRCAQTGIPCPGNNSDTQIITET